MGDYSKSYPNETLAVAVDDSGILQFLWEAPYTIIKKVTDNVELLPFMDVISKIKKQIMYYYTYNENEKTVIDTYEFKCIKLQLSYLHIPKKNDDTHRYLIPVWYIHGAPNVTGRKLNDSGIWEEFDSTVNMNDKSEVWMRYHIAQFSINAIDGSVL